MNNMLQVARDPPLEGLAAQMQQVTTVLKYPPEIKKVPDDMIIFSKITV